jgi:hypothetical protein
MVAACLQLRGIAYIRREEQIAQLCIVAYSCKLSQFYVGQEIESTILLTPKFFAVL